jgi:hypothetical protein
MLVVSGEELIGATEHVILYARCGLSRCLYNRVRLYLILGRRPAN